MHCLRHNSKVSMQLSVGGFKVQHYWTQLVQPRLLYLELMPANMWMVRVYLVKHAAHCELSAEHILWRATTALNRENTSDF